MDMSYYRSEILYLPPFLFYFHDLFCLREQNSSSHDHKGATEYKQAFGAHQMIKINHNGFELRPLQNVSQQRPDCYFSGPIGTMQPVFVSNVSKTKSFWTVRLVGVSLQRRVAA